MSTSHLDRKDLKRPDTFLEKAAPVVSYVNKNTKTVLGIVVVLAALGASIAIYFSRSDAKNETAISALYNAKKDLPAALEKTKTDADWEQKNKAALDAVAKVTTDFRGTRASFEAAIYLGDTYFERGNATKAADFYKQAVDNAGNRAGKTAALHALAYALEDTKQNDAAIDALRQVVATGDKTLKGDALVALARNYELKGDKAKAVEHYDQVIKEYPNTALAKTAESLKNQK